MGSINLIKMGKEMSTQLNIELNDHMMKRLANIATVKEVSIEDTARFYLDKSVPRKHNKRVITLELNSTLFKTFSDVCKQQEMSIQKLIKTLIEEEIDFHKEKDVEEVEE